MNFEVRSNHSTSVSVAYCLDISRSAQATGPSSRLLKIRAFTLRYNTGTVVQDVSTLGQ